MKATLRFSGLVDITINDPDVVKRITGPDGDEWRAAICPLYTQDDVLKHLAYNCIRNGQTNAKRLDGWADLPESAVSMQMRPDIEIERER